jgi:SAM-dependent methyltransferase
MKPAASRPGPSITRSFVREDDFKSLLDDSDETAAFGRLVRRAVVRFQPRRVLDVGCGAGLPTLEAALAGAPRVVGIDVEPRNVFLARGNIRSAGLEARVTAHSASWEDVLSGTFYPGQVDLVVANPPYVPSGDGVAVDGGPTGTRLLDSIIDGMPASVRGTALLFGSLSDPHHVLSRLERRGMQIVDVFAQPVRFGRYTSAAPTLAALHRLRARRMAWFCDAPNAPDLAPHEYLRLAVFAQRVEHPQPRRVVPFREFQRSLARLLEVYQQHGCSALSGAHWLQIL